MKLSTQNYRGTRDFYPDDMRLQKYIFGVWREICEQFGYEEYLSPLLESTEVYLAKSSEEIVREQTYTFNDRGDRSVTIRPEMTPSLARMVAAKRQELGYPLRMYSIANYMRYERTQRGRLREFWQLNVDIFGVSDISAEYECIMLASQIMHRFGAKQSMYEVRLNSRNFVNYLLSEYLGFSEVEVTSLVRLIDRKDKMNHAEFVALAEASISPSQRDSGSVTKLVELLSAKTLADLPTELQAHSSLQGLTEIIKLLEDSGVTNARFDVGLMRGFDYYTDIVFEVFDLHPDNNRAMFGGGRYDGLVGQFGVEPVATFGFAPGDVATELFLRSHDLAPSLSAETEVWIVSVDADRYQLMKLAQQMRAEGVNVAVDFNGKKIGASIKTADKKHIGYVMVVGDNELETQRFKLKNLKTGVEEEHSIERIITKLKDSRQ